MRTLMIAGAGLFTALLLGSALSAAQLGMAPIIVVPFLFLSFLITLWPRPKARR